MKIIYSYIYIYIKCIKTLPNFNFPFLQSLILVKYFNPFLHFLFLIKSTKELVLSLKKRSED